jgi:methyl coenzyme M reductase gamma subunit
MDIEKIASDSGMLVVLDGRIGREEYKSVYGSVQALQRFANSIRELVASETCIARVDRVLERLN